MDLDLTPAYSTSTRSPDNTEIDTPPHKTQPITVLSFTNSALKNHHRPPSPPAAAAVAYKECMKNHAANIGAHAVDGCGEFMPSPASKETEPTSLKCAACGCHRNFHRQELESPTTAVTPPFLDFRHPPLHKRFSLSPSPPPPPLAALPYAPPHFLLTGFVAEEQHQEPATPMAENPVGRKRFRTKFSQEQKVKMQSFSEKIGWKMQKCDEDAVKEFCHEIGVSKGVLKVWMHNNKNTLGKKEINGGGSLINNRSISFENLNGGGKSEEEKIDNGGHFQNESENGVHIRGSSSS
ncbi:hypothetical protein CDL12_03197 [Handroanthus impetiginosus]|uniref:ZF-HD dimerization-type domain-containing protein n=1 Tax=Handroanthus impetiginosus TaxID=429701 RepID=A0A2G9I2U8_9LAMI|nr:hypothetical protein CDL12_03197 [Handroanthus impetiginosus]